MKRKKKWRIDRKISVGFCFQKIQRATDKNYFAVSLEGKQVYKLNGEYF